MHGLSHGEVGGEVFCLGWKVRVVEEEKFGSIKANAPGSGLINESDVLRKLDVSGKDDLSAIGGDTRGIPEAGQLFFDLFELNLELSVFPEGFIRRIYDQEPAIPIEQDVITVL